MSANSQGDDVWASGAAYDTYMGRWSRILAREFAGWLGLPAGIRWLDVGCGTGALSQAILEIAFPREVVGIDPSEGYVDYAREHVTDSRARFDVGDAQSLPYPDAEFGAAVSGLVLNFVPEPARALREMARVIRPGGTVAISVWDYAGNMQMLRHFWDAAIALDQTARDLDEGRRFPLCQPDLLTEMFGTAELTDIRTDSIDVPTSFSDFDDYWAPFLGGQGPAPGYVASLSEAWRAALKERVRASLSLAPDGSINLIARAWVIQGKRG